MAKLWKKQIVIPKHNFIKKHEGGVDSYVDPRHERLGQIRKRQNELYEFSKQTRKEQQTLRVEHESIISELSGVKIK